MVNAKVKSNTLFILNWLLWLLLPKIGLLFNLTSGHSAPRRQSTIFTFSGGRLFQVFSSQRLHHLFLSHDLNLSLSLSSIISIAMSTVPNVWSSIGNELTLEMGYLFINFCNCSKRF